VCKGVETAVKKLLILISALLLLTLTACGNSGGTKFRIAETFTESRFFDEDGREVSEEEFREMVIVDFPNITVQGCVLDINKRVYQSDGDGEIVFEGFGRRTIFVGWYFIYGATDFKATFNGESISHWSWWAETGNTQDHNMFSYAVNLSLTDEINELILLMTFRNGSYIRKTVFIEPM
jgi:predicted small lipoprotein YifL